MEYRTEIMSVVMEYLRQEHEAMKNGNIEHAIRYNDMKLGAARIAAIALTDVTENVIDIAAKQLSDEGFEFYLA